MHKLNKSRHKEKWTHLYATTWSTATLCFERNSDGVEKNFRRNQVTLKPLAMAFKARNSLQIISLLLFFFFAFAGLLDCLLLWLKSRTARGTSHHTAFMGNCSTISQTFLALSTQCMSSPSRKWERGVRFHLVVFVFGVNQEN